MFCIFEKNSKKNDCHFWRVKYLLNLGKASLHRYPVGKNFAKFALSGTVFKIQAFLCFAFLKKIQKKNGCPFWRVKYLLNLGKASLHRYPVGKNFAKFALSGTVFKIQAFLCFPSFLLGQKIFENWVSYSAEISCGSKISLKLLYLARFSRYNLMSLYF